MKIKFPVITTVLRYLYMFIIGAVIFPVIFSYSAGQKLKIQDFEQVNVFMAAKYKDDTKYTEFKSLLFNGMTSEIVSNEIYDYTDEKSSQVSLYSYLLERSDILIFNSDYLANASLTGFHELPEKYCTESTYKEKYGIKIYDKATKTGKLTEYIAYEDQDYYLLINSKSIHVKSLEPDNIKMVSDNAMTVIKNIVGY